MNATTSFPPLVAKSVGNIAEEGQKEALGSAALQCLFHLLPLEKSFISNARTAEHFSKLLLQNLEVFSGSSEHAAEHITILMEDDGNTSQNVSETMAMSIALHAYQVAMRQTLDLATSLLAKLKVDPTAFLSLSRYHTLLCTLYLHVPISFAPRAMLNSIIDVSVSSWCSTTLILISDDAATQLGLCVPVHAVLRPSAGFCHADPPGCAPSYR